MPKDEPLRPDDFPVEADKTKLKTQKGEDVASVKSEKKAEDVADRLNQRQTILKPARCHRRMVSG
jgi:hypothetical protein